jgi:hypothetical protein
MKKVAALKTSRTELEEITMLQQPILPSTVLPEDQATEVNALELLTDDVLDEAGWLALLIMIDQEEGGP